ncbi:chitin synthase [Rhizodiscina lignyota]|uniref:Chitin synthase A n=1 Tax=Rhizodiscina lignyota TaxID=1504668 RepID=A0A9P4IHJ3_9PEZI|nr:chitin synthase [Rhizodiscina lignyota]
MDFNFNNRTSTFSAASVTSSRRAGASSQQVSTQTLLNALHTCYQNGQAFSLEPSTSLAVNTWVTASKVGPDGRYGGTVDVDVARKAWEHARRRAEDGCVVLGSLHDSTPSMFAPFVSALPINVPPSFYTSLDVLKAFTHCVTPHNPSFARHSALSATFEMNLTGVITGASLALSTAGLDTHNGLLHVPDMPGYRAFNVFYYLNSSSASQAERDFLDLKPPSSYTLLKRSGTFQPPSYLPTEDDAASGEEWRSNLRRIGIKGADQRNLISVLAGLLKLGETLSYLVDEEVLNSVCDDAAQLLDLDVNVLRRKCDTIEREVLIAGIYEAVVDFAIARANETIRKEVKGIKMALSSAGSDTGSRVATPHSSHEDENEDKVSITVVEIPNQEVGKAIALRNVFDDTEGINAEMKEDGVQVGAAGSSVIKEMKTAVAEAAADLGISDSHLSREREQERDRRQAVLEKVAAHADNDTYLKEILCPEELGVTVGKTGRFNLAHIIASSRVWFQLGLHPTDEAPATLANTLSGTSGWSAGAVSRQLRAWRLPEWANRRNKSLDFTADFDYDEFVTRYSRLGCTEGRDGVENWVMERGWSNGEVALGKERVWIREAAWWEAENMLDMKPMEDHFTPGSGVETPAMDPAYGGASVNASGFFGNQPFNDAATLQGSKDNLLQRHYSSATLGMQSQMGARSLAPTQAAPTARNVSVGDYGLGNKGDDRKGEVTYYGELDPELGDPKFVTEQPTSNGRRIWVAVVWTLTFWIPSPLLRYVGRMKRPDVRMAWREKLVLIFFIFIMNAIIIFYIIEFGRLLCPNFDKAWNAKEVSTHQGNNDFWVSHHGKVYDVSKFWKLQHSDLDNIDTTQDVMQPFAGTNLDDYITPPLTLACPALIPANAINNQLELTSNDTITNPSALHTSGPTLQQVPTTKLHQLDWYSKVFLPRMAEYHKGDLVVTTGTIKSEGQNNNHMWAIIDNSIYDLTDYFHTQTVQKNNPNYHFFPEDVENLFKNNPGEDITNQWIQNLNATTKAASMQCLQDMFYKGKTDFRDTPRCKVNNYILLAFTIILCTVIGVKFLAALQLGSKRRPAQQDKFVICQVPAYTEGEDSLRKGLDSLTALAYDNKRKLICVICDGMIVGGGNDRPTPKIVLDILGVDPKIDPPALPFRSVGTGSEQLNYGKVYSGLYEYEGNVVPYVVVVKVGKESEQHKAKPGNRGKRDSQIMIMSFLNRVHHRSPMSPLELEMFHQINNVIGVDPELYEYLLMVDADTSVKEDSLNRLVASCANDARIAGICGETSLENEERSWWTMIQVYEYYISHHLSKAFESLFGSVTCLPGCYGSFCMYRLRTADKGKPLIISDKVISEYSDCNVDTLHKKNLLSLGEDRYLTTLMTKHFPQMSYKFISDAYALTAAPETWSVLLSQRRRWINSTIHNLVELVFLKDLCGFCCFSMRFVVFIDLFGTIILPATCTYLGYLIYTAASHSGQFPIISIVILAAVYGLQAIIFLIKRQWQHIGWMIIYILAFPIYSFVLPIYSFWKQDDFSWGNTRVVIGEKGNKQVVMETEEGFDPRSIPLQRWDDYALANNLPGRRGLGAAVEKGTPFEDGEFEMDEMQSQYSSVRPASTVLTGFGGHHSQYMPPQGGMQSPGPHQGLMHRQSTYSNFSAYKDSPNPDQQRMMSMGGMSDHMAGHASPRASHSQSAMMNPMSQENLHASPYGRSSPNLLGRQSPQNQGRARSPLGMGPSRPVSTVNFQNMVHGPTDEAIVQAIRECLGEVDLDAVTKKQLKALAEQRLQTQLVGERKAFLDERIDFELANM